MASQEAFLKRMKSNSDGAPSASSEGTFTADRFATSSSGTSVDLAKTQLLTDALNSRLELPAAAYQPKFSRDDMVQREKYGFNTTGKECPVSINSYSVLKATTRLVYQYDVHIGKGVEKRIVCNKVWNSEAFQKKLDEAVGGKEGSSFIYDSNKLAWSLYKLPETLSVEVDLDEEQARRPVVLQYSRPTSGNVFRITIKLTGTVNLSALRAYCQGTMSWDNSVLECINFFDHLLRHTPSQKFFTIKRSFFDKKREDRLDLNFGVEAVRGVYQSMRIGQGGRLLINVDVANATFWLPANIHHLARFLTNSSDMEQLALDWKPTADWRGKLSSQAFMNLSRLKKIRVKVNYRGMPEFLKNKTFAVEKVLPRSSTEYTFRWIDARGTPNEEDHGTISIFDYFLKKYNLYLQYPELPVVEVNRKDLVFPMEALEVQSGQRYPYKLNEVQTAQMIKFAVSKPSRRVQAISNGLKMLDWKNDEKLKEYELQISSSMTQTRARILPPPAVQFANSVKIEPRLSGRWDLRGKKFLKPNAAPLISWGVGYFEGRIKTDKNQIEKIVNDFCNIYVSHGGRIQNRPVIVKLNPDAGKAVHQLYTLTGNKFKYFPQFFVFLVQNKESFHYMRLKKSSDCRFGVPSQVMQLAQALKGNPQYYSNVLLKVNAKLKGVNARASSTCGNKGFGMMSMVIGADVSHASPGSPQASTAAMTLAFDVDHIRYGAMCQTNGQRVEMITPANVKYCLQPLVEEWISSRDKQPPKTVYYFRDGVSEGQYMQVLDEEVRSIKGVLKDFLRNDEPMPKFVVIICSKRHHIRFFPMRDGDRNGNPVPGTLVERDVTDINGWDFYLNSHSAIQGTARPAHYSVILDEQGVKPNELQNAIYEASYQYLRSTTPVSLFPAVYYAHLASNRSAAHVDRLASEGPQTGPSFKPEDAKTTAIKAKAESELSLVSLKKNLWLDAWYL